MICRWHRWQLSHAADARTAKPPATQRHVAACAACRAYAEFCGRLPQALAARAPAPGDDFDARLLHQQILARTVYAPENSRPGKIAAPLFPGLGAISDFFANPWKPALAALAAAGLLLAAGLGHQYWDRAQARTTLAALQAVQLACDDAVKQGPAAVTGLLDAAAQHLADEARAAVDFFGAALPPAAQPNRS